MVLNYICTTDCMCVPNVPVVQIVCMSMSIGKYNYQLVALDEMNNM